MIRNKILIKEIYLDISLYGIVIDFFFSCCNHFYWYYKVRNDGCIKTYNFSQIDFGDCVSKSYPERQNQ